ncbi:glutathione S-transferase N-terminal domain-containing protein [Halioxenophilus sp. WMMB6]|uniref:glutathione S-transferase N-terminal domain-containing protein n=1 Tax=Halioxenophilus sp. WMMB6 TaxID=3073815 RepID=UPI00295E786B|nr:glutathione S-transferase N-terminal domain-containing protein [Halioxenophilus sp. WMMB6]
MSDQHTAKAYLKCGCPFSFKLVMFLAEAQLLDKVELIRVDANSPEELDEYRDFLQAQTGRPASFPTVEIAPGDYMGDSDALIEWFASQYQVDETALPGLAYYKANLFPAYLAHYRELKALKAAAPKVDKGQAE